MERRLNSKTFWTLPKAFGDAAKCKPGSQAESCCCIFTMSRKFNTSPEHNCIPATCCCDDVCSVQALSWIEIAGFRKFQQTSCITHKVFIPVEVCTPAMPFHTRLADDDLHDQGFPKRSARILIFSKPPEMYILCFCKTMFCSTAGSDKPRAFRGVPPAALGRTALGWIDLLNLEEGMVFRQLSIQGSDVLRQNGMIKWTVYSNMAVFSLLDLGRYLIGVRRQQRKHNVERNYGS